MKNKVFWTILVLIILLVLIQTFFRIYNFKDYFVVDEVFCDINSEECFVRSFEEKCFESEDSNCMTTNQKEYYKVIYKKAYNIQTCLYETGTENLCQLSCGPHEDETECFYEYCTDNCNDN